MHDLFPVVTFSDMMEILTNYDYTIDAVADAGGAPETFAPEAGYGIISAQQMCRWVEENCPASCPGERLALHVETRSVGRTSDVSCAWRSRYIIALSPGARQRLSSEAVQRER